MAQSYSTDEVKTEMGKERGKLTGVLLILQIVFIVLFSTLIDYDSSADARSEENNKNPAQGGADPDNNILEHYYPMFQDVQVMIFVGFGFLMTFLKKYGFSSVGYNFLLASFTLQWATILTSFWELQDGKAHIGITKLISAEFAAGAVLISFGAVLGKLSPFQLIVMTFLELAFYNVNEHIGLYMFKVVDAGGSMFVHTFGAYFGITVARVVFKKGTDENENEGSVYHSDMMAMIGTLFLWMFWPSFNSALVPGAAQQRAVINTYFSLSASCVMAFATSYILGEDRKRFDMVHIQNSTLAGGVAVGTCANFMIHPWGALFIGSWAGALSALGYHYLTPLLNSKGFHDTCGVNNLHGMPGIFAGLAGIVATAVANTESYGRNLYTVFPARAPVEGSAELLALQSNLSQIEAGDGRTAFQQAEFQTLALVVTLVFAIVGGLFTGLILRIRVLFEQPPVETIHEDMLFWNVPEHGYDVPTPRIDIERASKQSTSQITISEYL